MEICVCVFFRLNFSLIGWMYFFFFVDHNNKKMKENIRRRGVFSLLVSCAEWSFEKEEEEEEKTHNDLEGKRNDW